MSRFDYFFPSYRTSAISVFDQNDSVLLGLLNCLKYVETSNVGCAVFYVPANTVYGRRETIAM